MKRPYWNGQYYHDLTRDELIALIDDFRVRNLEKVRQYQAQNPERVKATMVAFRAKRKIERYTAKLEEARSLLTTTKRRKKAIKTSELPAVAS